MPLWTMLYATAFWPLLFALCAMLWHQRNCGGAITATIMVAGYCAGYLSLSRIDYLAFEGRLAAIDAMMFAALTWSATKWPRWPFIFIAASQLLAVSGHMGRLIDPEMSRRTYAILTGGMAYFQLICLSIEIWIDTRYRRSKERHCA